MLILKNKELKELFLSLPPEDKQLFQQHSLFIDKQTTTARFCMIVGANLLPHGHGHLAEKLFLYGLSVAIYDEDKARLHLNLVQLYLDYVEQNHNCADYYRLFNYHRHQCLTLGYFESYLNTLSKSNLNIPI